MNISRKAKFTFVFKLYLYLGIRGKLSVKLNCFPINFYYFHTSSVKDFCTIRVFANTIELNTIHHIKCRVTEADWLV